MASETRRTADGGTITDGVYTPDFDALPAERLRELLDEYTDISTTWRAANPLSASRYDDICGALYRKAINPNTVRTSPQPIRYMNTNRNEQVTIDSIAAALTEKLGRMIGIEKIHRSADRIDVLVDNGIAVRVQVQVLR